MKILQTQLTKHLEGRMAIRHGIACKPNIPGWVGEAVGVGGDRLPDAHVVNIQNCSVAGDDPNARTWHKNKHEQPLINDPG